MAATRIGAPMLGVLGGMGPLASAQFMLRLTLLTDAARDQDHIPAVLWSDPRVPDRTAARIAGGEDPLPALLRGIAGLQAAGCGAIAIPCNTAHGWIEGMQAATPLPILHIVDAAEAELRRLGVAPGPIGVMGTAGTLAMRLYQARLEARGWTCLVPEAAEMATLVSPGIAEVKANRITAAYEPLAEAAQRLVVRGARAVVLGCTEIPLGIAAGPALPFPVCDTIDGLARAAIAWAGRSLSQSGSATPAGLA
ncbi:cysteate racemase [Falsiroseomonas selenitidurans]|uniref:Aspartate/glutamate racemase family protein n=1 Tax=Falsiroseomonas selenitidurans TaxID=2716335 RepID=A0ABX1EBD9_9PROT|nr:amino acid racemase [Falsiroseomonas selenitidurans]NKC34125.1 aspartate/glutamate racemase family protein [Falsiroseomonas selenitidurans]